MVMSENYYTSKKNYFIKFRSFKYMDCLEITWQCFIYNFRDENKEIVLKDFKYLKESQNLLILF